MSIQLVTYANQTVTPTNDAIIYERAIDQNGIFYGCNVTVSSNEVHITGGYGIVCGREFTIQSEAITVTLAPSGTLDGRLYVRLDLADADNPIQLLTATGNTLPPLEQDDDVNYTNGTYEMELATFTVGVSSLSDVVETFETIYGSKQYKGIEIRKLLWTNPSPSASFTAQTISLDLTDYDSVEILYKGYSSYGMSNVAIADIDTTSGQLFSHINAGGTSYPLIFERSFSVTSSGVQFSACNGKYTNSTGTSAQNSGCVPYKIYGYKTL